MNLPRLMILGLLTHLGPCHGHQVRRVAEQTQVAGWGGVSFGSLYRELRLMGPEGLVESVRIEKVGNRPFRTVYRITEAGRRELLLLWRRAIREPSLYGPDAFAVALLFGRVLDKAELAGLLRERREELAGMLASIAGTRERGLAAGEIGAIDVAVFRRGEARLEAELRWQEDFERTLEGLPEAVAAEGPGSAGAGPAGGEGSARSGRKAGKTGRR